MKLTKDEIITAAGLLGADPRECPFCYGNGLIPSFKGGVRKCIWCAETGVFVSDVEHRRTIYTVMLGKKLEDYDIDYKR